mgnify:CR=1 FL=1
MFPTLIFKRFVDASLPISDQKWSPTFTKGVRNPKKICTSEPWLHLGGAWVILAAFWSVLMPYWDHFGTIWGALGIHFGSIWDHFGDLGGPWEGMEQKGPLVVDFGQLVFLAMFIRKGNSPRFFNSPFLEFFSYVFRASDLYL